MLQISESARQWTETIMNIFGSASKTQVEDPLPTECYSVVASKIICLCVLYLNMLSLIPANLSQKGRF